MPKFLLDGLLPADDRSLLDRPVADSDLVPALKRLSVPKGLPDRPPFLGRWDAATADRINGEYVIAKNM